MMASSVDAAENLNRSCQCAVVDLASVRARIDVAVGASSAIVDTHPNLFSEIPVFLAPAHLAAMQRTIEAIESIAGSSAWQAEVLESAPAIAKMPVAPRGVFFGYDFHVGADGPRLIEINSNAGGAFLNIAARDAQIACCEAGLDYLKRLPDGRQLEDLVIAMFRREWRLARGDAPLRSIAIVDDDPLRQFLYPEFLLAQRLFESRGIAARIADVSELRIVEGRAVVDGEPIDLVYNRSTDFYFESAGCAVLRQVYEDDLALVTPHPRAHALYANKRNLVKLSNGDYLAALGVAPDAIGILRATVPVTRDVTGDGEAWWKDRKEWFFKPHSGFGSRGTYRGDKITRRVFGEVLNGGYIAQALTPAGARLGMKADVRCYTYEGRILLMAARLYEGQTTNFRTAGGGFAPVYVTA
jgi:hypothetical protein